jgi:hypothetical protein
MSTPHTPGPSDSAISQPVGPGFDLPAASRPPCTCGHDRVERLFHLAPCPRSERGDRLPRHLEVVLDIQHLVAQALAILDRPVDPETYPPAPMAHAVDIGFEVVGYNLEAAMRELVKITELNGR